jgi:hypothetical protein
MSSNHYARRAGNALLKLWKRCLSYRKREWVLSDYPIVVRVQNGVPPSSRYDARILGWNIDGLGATKADALAEVRKWYETRRAALLSEGKPMPRPGTNVPITFASQERVIVQDELLRDFIHRVLQLEWAFITDESSLWNFVFDGDIDPLFARVREMYSVDVSDIVDGNIAEILERIAAARGNEFAPVESA